MLIDGNLLQFIATQLPRTALSCLFWVIMVGLLISGFQVRVLLGAQSKPESGLDSGFSTSVVEPTEQRAGECSEIMVKSSLRVRPNGTLDFGPAMCSTQYTLGGHVQMHEAPTMPRTFTQRKLLNVRTFFVHWVFVQGIPDHSRAG